MHDPKEILPLAPDLAPEVDEDDLPQGAALRALQKPVEDFSFQQRIAGLTRGGQRSRFRSRQHDQSHGRGTRDAAFFTGRRQRLSAGLSR